VKSEKDRKGFLSSLVEMKNIGNGGRRGTDLKPDLSRSKRLVAVTRTGVPIGVFRAMPRQTEYLDPEHSFLVEIDVAIS
jgi:hypothetical protein